MSGKDLTFVFEVCANCGTHQWNTRHDEKKYASYFELVAGAIKAVVPQANCVMNKVPKPWYEKEIYCQLIPNEDDNNPYYDILPRIGAFEVSIVVDNIDILFYSKQMSTMWPHGPSLAKRIHEFCSQINDTPASALKEKFQTTGRQVRAPRQRRGSIGGMTMTESQGNLHSHKADSQRSLEEVPQVQEQQPAVAQEQPRVEEAKQPEPAQQPAPSKQQQEPAVQQQQAEQPAQPEQVEQKPAQQEPAPAQEAPTQEAPAQAAPAQEATTAAEAAPAQTTENQPAAPESTTAAQQ